LKRTIGQKLPHEIDGSDASFTSLNMLLAGVVFPAISADMGGASIIKVMLTLQLGVVVADIMVTILAHSDAVCRGQAREQGIVQRLQNDVA
jgi:hypothetical protein